MPLFNPFQHTSEQLEAAHRDGNKVTATRIILRHLRTLDPSITLGRAANLTSLYWIDPPAALISISSWTPELDF
jgi:hypothetical protein